MKKNGIKTIVFFCLLFISQNLFAQEGLDLKEEAKAYQELERIPVSFGSKSDELLWVVDLKPFCPEAADRGDLPSGVGWAVGYGAMTILHAQQNGWSGNEINEQAFSAMYIYNNVIRKSCEGGASLARAGKFIKEFGNCRSRAFDVDPNNCQRKASTEEAAIAKQYRIKGGFPVFGFDEKPKKKTYLTKRCLADSTPVVVGMEIRANFKTLNADNKYWKPMEGDTTMVKKGVALVVVGYDDKKRAFQMMNSKGPSWGKDGFVWVRYQDFQKYCYFGHQYVLDGVTETESVVTQSVDSEPLAGEQLALKGAFSLRYPFFSEESEELLFEYINPKRLKNHYYEMDKKDWGIGDQFQLVVNEMEKGQYLYVFSVDDEGVHEHWPRANETAIIPYKRIGVIIPDEEMALTKRVEGNDNICILYSNEAISDYKLRLKKIGDSKGVFKSRFETVFGDLIIPSDSVGYEEERMEFSVDTKTQGILVPIVLTVEEE